MSWAGTAATLGPIRPRRWATRWTWVSTGRAGRPKEKSRTQAAVLGPTPGSSVSHDLASAMGMSSSREASQSGPRRVAELGEQGLHAWGLGSGQSAGSDGVFQFLDRGFKHGVPVRIALEEVLEGAAGVGVGSVLRQQGEDEFSDRIVGRPPGRERRFADEAVDDRGGTEGFRGLASARYHARQPSDSRSCRRRSSASSSRIRVSEARRAWRSAMSASRSDWIASRSAAS